MSGIVRDRATRITEAAAQAELDFYRDIHSDRRIVTAFEGELATFVARKKLIDSMPVWFIEVSARWLQPVPLRDSALAVRLEFLRDWKIMRKQYITEIEALEGLALELFP